MVCVLQCVAVGSKLQCIAAGCSVLQCVSECCSKLQVCAAILSFHTEFALHSCDAVKSQLYFHVMQCVAVCCSVLQCVAVCCSVLKRVVVCCSVLQCVAVYNTPFCQLSVRHLCTCPSHPPWQYSPKSVLQVFFSTLKRHHFKHFEMISRWSFQSHIIWHHLKFASSQWVRAM